ncbi:MAG: penicillin-binding transpeptidase domain-containing protein [Bacteroidetes bacterium]|nr:penicillin-binding transpeptidase domain-containing protein [Bacteroidota bacterium]
MRAIFSGLILPILVVFSACSPNNVKIDKDLQHFFDEKAVVGTFGLYENGSGQFVIHNMARFRDSAYLPASTFKIVNSLIGIETGRIVNEKMIIKWDGIVRPFPMGDSTKTWNKDLTMEEAFKRSALPYYQEVARRIGKDTMQFWLDSLKYGSKKIVSPIDRFWLDNTLKITADEEMGFVKKLYFNQLPFQKRTQDIVKKVMVQEENANFKLAYKTGTGTLENGKTLCWIVGWVEENRHPYFFVMNMEGKPEANIMSFRLDLLKSILKQQGFLEGKR